MEIYLDNSSTTRPYQAVCDKVAEVMRNNYGNPSSLHRLGIAAEKEVKAAAEALANALGVRPDEIFFTSGGTESNNIALRGAFLASRGNQIISTPVEHPATLNTLDYLEGEDCHTDFVPVDSDGRVILSEFEKLLSSDTAVVTAMLVNNEIGTIQPIPQMAKLIRSKAPKAVFHVDAVQGFCKVPCKARELGADMISISGHKIHGPKGIGALYVKRGTALSPIIFGGGQQHGIRPGTENVPGIAGLGTAAARCFANSAEAAARMSELKERLKNSFIQNIDNIRVNTPERSAPHILNVSFGGVKSEVLLHSLENEGIYVSSGSACSSHKKEPSYVLTEIGVDRAMIDGSIRFSLSEFTTAEDIDKTAAATADIVKRLRKLNLR